MNKMASVILRVFHSQKMVLVLLINIFTFPSRNSEEGHRSDIKYAHIFVANSIQNVSVMIDFLMVLLKSGLVASCVHTLKSSFHGRRCK